MVCGCVGDGVCLVCCGGMFLICFCVILGGMELGLVGLLEIVGGIVGGVGF